jgi:hypothetical protein
MFSKSRNAVCEATVLVQTQKAIGSANGYRPAGLMIWKKARTLSAPVLKLYWQLACNGCDRWVECNRCGRNNRYE